MQFNDPSQKKIQSDCRSAFIQEHYRDNKFRVPVMHLKLINAFCKFLNLYVMSCIQMLCYICLCYSNLHKVYIVSYSLSYDSYYLLQR